MLSSSLSACSTLRSQDKGALNLGYSWRLWDSETHLVRLSQWVRRLTWRDEQSALGCCSSRTVLLYSQVLESYSLWVPQLPASPVWDLERSVLQPVIPFSPDFFSTPNCGECRGEALKRKHCTHSKQWKLQWRWRPFRLFKLSGSVVSSDSCHFVLGFRRWEESQCSRSPGLSALSGHQMKMPGTRHPAVFDDLRWFQRWGRIENTEVGAPNFLDCRWSQETQRPQQSRTTWPAVIRKTLLLYYPGEHLFHSPEFHVSAIGEYKETQWNPSSCFPFS